VREHVTPETRMIFSDGVEDPWMITIHLTGIIDRSFNDTESFWKLPQLFDGSDVEELQEFCSEDVPVVFVFRKKARRRLAADVIEMCATHESVEADWPGDLVNKDERRRMLAKRSARRFVSSDPAEGLED
jgi:hypothetical protein